MMNESHSVIKKPKLLEVGNEDKEDRISQLPDEILCHILSFLPTNYAVTTCILSSRWKLVWTSLTKLWFNDRFCLEYECTRNLTGERFENFVDRVLLLTHPASITGFHLRCGSKFSDLSRLKSWVSSAIMRNVRELQLEISVCPNPVELPESLCTLKTLEVLVLFLEFVIKLPPSGMCFPSLKSLTVLMRKPDKNLTERLFSICPVLEELSIIAYFYDDNFSKNFNISSFTLKRLRIHAYRGSYFRYNDHKVVIRAPKLERLFILDEIMMSYMVHELHSLTFVSVKHKFYTQHFKEDFDPPNLPPNRVLKLVKGITNTKLMELYAGTLTGLDSGFQNFFPTFPNLTHLFLEVGKSRWKFIPIILGNAPKLEMFFFEKGISMNTTDDPGGLGWIEPQCVPQCLQLHVKRIKIIKFEGQKDELELVKYLLKNGKVLEIMRFSFCESALKEKLCQNILMFPRCSTKAQVEFL